MASGFTIDAGVCPTTHATVLLAVVQALRDGIEELAGESRCFLSDTAQPGTAIHENVFCTVSTADGSYESAPMVGAGSVGVLESAGIRVTVWSRMQLDRLEHSAWTLTESTRGLLPWKQRLLAILAGVQLYDRSGAVPVPLLIAPLAPLRSMHPSLPSSHDSFHSFSLLFQATFLWDLG